MWEPGGPSRRQDGSTFTREISVLLVDHNKDWLISTANVLHAFAYKVTAVERATTALLIISEKKDNIDVVMVDIDLPDLDALTLVGHAVKMELLPILMSANEDDSMVNRAIESGAFRMIEKPVTKGALKYLWQHVMRERMMRKNNKTGNKGVRHLEISMVGENHKLDDQSKGKQLEEDKRSETNNRDDDGTSTKKLKSRKYARKSEKGESTNKTKAGRVRRKVCTEWTDELHSKFMVAVGQLGEGRCYPKEILEHMNVPGLTRMQVASHLQVRFICPISPFPQKCRNANWRAPEERKSLPPCAPTSSNPHQHVPPRKFGSMPHLLKKPNSAQPHLHEGPEIYPSVEMDQHMNPQPYLMPEEYGSQPLPQTFGMQNMEQLGSGVEDICNAVDQSDIFNVRTHGNGGTFAGMAYQQTFNPILPNFSNATFGTSSHVGSSSQRQPPAETFGIFSELDDLPQSYSIFPEGSLIPQSLTTQDSISNFEAYSQQVEMHSTLNSARKKMNQAQAMLELNCRDFVSISAVLSSASSFAHPSISTIPCPAVTQ
ncbi:hypothetical protein RJ639_009221 [Escallonia herrerae]|uniref:Two-component response regulator n=1 Tax=Escallonia herrerae TaxID=1293975 RepID=A0AA88VSP0_9ASTE|nr:hypothetical protein RJ639_009221 [Escallonia herrerae]